VLSVTPLWGPRMVNLVAGITSLLPGLSSEQPIDRFPKCSADGQQHGCARFLVAAF